MSRGPSALDRASSALNKSNSSFKGRRSLLDSETSDDAAELNQFLAGLSQKTAGGSKTGASKHAIPQGLSDISISSDEEYKKKKVQSKPSPSIGGSKFLKSAKTADSSQTVANYSKALPQKSVTSSAANQSPALLRLSQQAQKFMKNSQVTTGSSPPRKSANSLYTSEDATIISETSESIGGNMNKFLKSKQAPAVEGRKKTPLPVAHSLRTSTEDDSDMAAYIQGLSATASEVSEEIKPQPSKPKSFMKKPVISAPKTVEVEVRDDSSFATETFSAESSIASESRTMSKPLTTNRSVTEKTDDYESDIATDSDGPLGGNVVMDIDALSLEPTLPPTKKSSHQSEHKPSSKSKSPKRKDSKTNQHKSKDGKQSKSDDIYGTMGLMSVDDLLQTQSSIRTTSVRSRDERSIKTESSIKSYEPSPTRNRKSEASSESSIHTYQDSVKTQSIDSEIRTHSVTKTKSDVYDSDFDDTLRETESIRTDDESIRSRSSRTRTRSYSSAYSSASRSSPSRSRSRSNSSANSDVSRSRTASYTASISRRDTSRSEASTHTRSESLSRSKSRSRSPDSRSESNKSVEYTASFEDHSDTVSVPKTSAMMYRHKVQSADAAIQTGLDLEEMILKYYWMSEQAIPSVTGQHQVRPSPAASDPGPVHGVTDPTRIASMAVSSEALDVLTTYNPAMLALNDMMKQQVELSRQFLNMQQDMHKNIMSSIEKEHHYTTLEETKQFIESKRKPRLTFEEALSMVKDEMGL